MDFSIQAEDDSCYQVARSLVNLHNQVAGGDYAYVAQLRASAPAAVGASAREARPAGAGGGEEDGSSSSSSGEEDGEEEGEEEGGDAMDVDAPPARPPRAAPVVDEDGFTTVARRSRR
jgi:pre-rRNA-processing protein TSR2